ncbi:MAG TPA: hypothetical protein VKR28_01345 [Candidatus Binatus sp.]|nr:hypothetical protein [Candidatus Binatus sp.]
MSIKDKPVMINGDLVLRIMEIPGAVRGQRGCHVYVSHTEFLEVDQSIHEMMIALGFEERS